MANLEHVESLLIVPIHRNFYELDLSDYDFTGRSFTEIRFYKCNFSGSKLCRADFSSSNFDKCELSGTDWNRINLTGAIINADSLRGIKNASKAIGLRTVRAYGLTSGFETYIPRLIDRIDWELIKTVGRLPLFGASSFAIIFLPMFFYLLDEYNQRLTNVKSSFQLAQQTNPSIHEHLLFRAIDRFEPLSIPHLSLISLGSAVILFLASLIYAFLCPTVVKDFSLNVWMMQLDKNPLSYKAEAWRFPITRMICSLFYLIGGASALCVLADKLIRLALYLIAHTTSIG